MIKYCEKWSLHQKAAIKPLEESQARKRHESRKPYTVIVYCDDSPEYVVDLAQKFVSVRFLDELLRNYLLYTFQETSPGQLFLISASYWEHEGDTDDIRVAMYFRFSEDGHCLMEKRDFKTGEVINKKTMFKTKGFYEPYPYFGDYGSLCRKHRVNVSDV